MIAVAIGMVIIVGMALAMFVTYDSLQSNVDNTRRISTEAASERGREEISVEIGGGGGATIDSDWAEQTSITGLMVRCADGTIMTEDADLTVSPANTLTLSNDTIHARIEAMGAGCPAASDPASGVAYGLEAGHDNAHGMAHDGDRLYVAHGGPPSYIYAYDKNVTASTFPGTVHGKKAVTTHEPGGVAADDDYVYVLEPSSNSVYRYTKAMVPANWPGVPSNVLALGAPTPGGVTDGTGGPLPQGIGIHGSNLYAVDALSQGTGIHGTAHVYLYDKSTLSAADWPGTASNTVSVQYPAVSGIAVDGSGIYIASGAGNIYLHDMDMDPLHWANSSSHIRATGLDLSGITVDGDGIYVTDGDGVVVYGK